MLLEVLAVAVLVVVAWLVLLRPVSRYSVRPAYQLLLKAPQSAFDFVVVGSGPAGLAAARKLLDDTSASRETILLVEKGEEMLPDSRLRAFVQSVYRDRLLSFAPDHVFLPKGGGILPASVAPTFPGVCLDEGYVVHRPLRFPALGDEAARARKAAEPQSTDELFAYSTYPRGRGVGGGTLVDWGVHLKSLFLSSTATSASTVTSSADGGNDSPQDEVQSGWWRLPVRFTTVRNPLSWAFADAVVEANVLRRRHLSTPDRPSMHGTVYPLLLRLDTDGRKLPIASAVFRDVPVDELRRVFVLVNHTVTGMIVEKKSVPDSPSVSSQVTAVQCTHRLSGTQHTIRVSKGVLLCLGAVQTPRLLYGFVASNPTVPHTHAALSTTTQLRDCLALPMIFRVYPNLSADTANVRDAKGAAAWTLAHRGPYLQPMVDTVASVPLPELGPNAQMHLLLLPFGGRDARRFYQVGWDRLLGSFEDAATILLVLNGVEGLTQTLEVSEDAASPSSHDGESEESKTRRRLSACGLKPLAVLEQMTGEQAIRKRKMVAGFVRAMRACRTVTGTAPLSYLMPPRGGMVNGNAGEEAIDYSLLKDDPEKAVRLARLVHTRKSKRTAKMDQELIRLLEYAYDRVNTEAYMNQYVEQHAYWIGFGSGSSEPFLDPARPPFVYGLRNAAVGDASAITNATWSAYESDTLSAGSIATAMETGMQASDALLRSVQEE